MKWRDAFREARSLTWGDNIKAGDLADRLRAAARGDAPTELTGLAIGAAIWILAAFTIARIFRLL